MNSLTVPYLRVIAAERAPSIPIGGDTVPLRPSRRQFLGGLAAAGVAAALPRPLLEAAEPLYPPLDLSYFDQPITAKRGIKVGYAAITWNGNDRQAIEDIAALGYRGIQLRSNVLTEFPGGAAEVRDLLAQHHLTLVALSSGSVRVEANDEAGDLEKHVQNAKYLHEAGGLYLQVTDARPKRELIPADYKRLGMLLTQLGKRTADLGIPLGYHNHMGTIGQSPEEVDRVLASADPRYVKLELDIA